MWRNVYKMFRFEVEHLYRRYLDAKKKISLRVRVSSFSEKILLF